MRGLLRFSFVVFLALLTASMCSASEPAAPAKPAAKPAKPRPKHEPAFLEPGEAGPDFKFQGEYLGTPEGSDSPWGLQVIAQGNGKFRIVGYQGGLPGAGWDKILSLGCDAAYDPAQKAVVASMGYEDRKLSVKVTGDEVIVVDANEGSDPLAKFKRACRQSPTVGAKPPAGAVVLFDGLDTEHFKDGRMTPDHMLMEGTTTKDKFQSFTLHLEFRLPFMPTACGQGRANSGVYCQGRYEVQVLDSFGLKGDDNECGGIYKVSKPAVNMCLPPLAWQTYDIELTAAQYKDGQKTADARLTVRHNGVLIQDNLPVPHATPGNPVKEGPEAGPIYLQNHGDPVRFRNIWVVEKK